MRLPASLFLAFCLILAFRIQPAAQSSGDAAAADSLQRKLDQIERNGSHTNPQPVSTILTEQEVNAYVASGRVKLPAGVKSVRFSGMPGVVSSISRVDFDQLTAGQRSSNPMLGMFRGLHDVAVTAHASGAAGTGSVHVDTVQLDGVEIPNFVLQLFVDRYIKPKYPNLGLDSQFRLPDRIVSATIGQHILTVVQN